MTVTARDLFNQISLRCDLILFCTTGIESTFQLHDGEDSKARVRGHLVLLPRPEAVMAKSMQVLAVRGTLFTERWATRRSTLLRESPTLIQCLDDMKIIFSSEQRKCQTNWIEQFLDWQDESQNEESKNYFATMESTNQAMAREIIEERKKICTFIDLKTNYEENKILIRVSLRKMSDNAETVRQNSSELLDHLHRLDASTKPICQSVKELVERSRDTVDMVKQMNKKKTGFPRMPMLIPILEECLQKIAQDFEQDL